MNHTRRAHARLEHAGDNEDRLVSNFGIDTTEATIASKSYRNWVNNVMNWSTVGNDHQHQLRDIRTIRSYVGRDLDVYLCPADGFLSGNRAEEVDPPRSKSRQTPSLDITVILLRTGPRSSGAKPIRGWVAPISEADRVPSPAGIFVMLDEHPDWINDGYFI